MADTLKEQYQMGLITEGEYTRLSVVQRALDGNEVETGIKTTEATYIGVQRYRDSIGSWDITNHIFRVFCPYSRCEGTTKLYCRERHPENTLKVCATCNRQVKINF